MLPRGPTIMTRTATRLAIALIAFGGCSDSEDFAVTPIYNHANGRVVIQITRDIDSDETLFVQARRGNFGVLDCNQLAASIAPCA